MNNATADIFNRNRRAMLRDRAHSRGASNDGRDAKLVDDIIGRLIADSLLDRLGDVRRRFSAALVIGDASGCIAAWLRDHGALTREWDVGPRTAQHRGAYVGDEDQLDVDPESLDLIIWAGGGESVNNLPDALLRCRFALRPDGLLLGAMVGGGSFGALRAALLAAESDRPALRMHPQVALASLSDLLQRSGFALPVVDSEPYQLSYRSLANLVRDLRAAGLSHHLAQRPEPLTRATWARAAIAFLDGADSRTEQLNLLHFIGWASAESQPKPAPRGSATVSLSDVLRIRQNP